MAAEVPDEPRGGEASDPSDGAGAIGVLGPVALLGDDAGRLGGPKQRLILAVLVREVGRVIPTDRLVAAVWGADADGSARRTLQVYVSRLRTALEGVASIAHRDGGYVLEVAEGSLDVARFEECVETGTALARDAPDEAAGQLRAALDLWRGPPFGDLASEAALSSEVTRLEQLRLRAFEELARIEIDRGRGERVVPRLRQLASEHPLREPLWSLLMLALYRSGRHGEALEAYGTVRHVLAEELGSDPSRDLQDLHTAILRQDPSLDRPDAHARRTSGAVGGPQPLEPLTEGRSAEEATGPARASAATPRSVAVLPFEVLGGSDDVSSLATGLHSDVLARLGRIPELTVISRTSVMSYRGTAKAASTIAAELGVGTVVEGLVQSAGQRFRLLVQLIDGPADVSRWSQTYDRELTTEDLFEVQSELAQDIAASLSAELEGADETFREGPQTRSLAAYRAAAEARQQLDLRTAPSFERAVELFEEAIDADPGYADAWVGLADALTLTEDYGYGDAEELFPRAEQAIERALALDPTSAPAHASLGLLRSADQDGPAAIRELERAIRLQPSYADAHNWHSWVSVLLGRGEAALASARRAVELNPLSAESIVNLALSCWATGRDERAISEARRSAQLSSWTTADFYAALSLYELGRLDEARVLLEPLHTREADQFSVAWALHGPDVMLALVLIGLDDHDAARDILSAIDPDAHPFAHGMVHLGLGDVEEAESSFERVESMGPWPTLATHHRFDRIWARIEGTRVRGALVDTAHRSWGMAPPDGDT